MKVQMIKGKVAVSLEEKSHEFLSDCYGCFNGFEGYGYLRMNYAECITEELRVREDYKTLKTILFYADLRGIEVEDEVTATLAAWRERIDEWDRQARERNRKYTAMEKWQRIKSRGCGHCEHCRRTGFDDDFICAATGETLPTENIGLAGTGTGASMGINALYCYAPFPSEGCPYKTAQLDANDKDYLAWKDEELLAGF